VRKKASRGKKLTKVIVKNTRSLDAGDGGRIYGSWINKAVIGSENFNQEIISKNDRVRAAARDHEINNPYGARSLLLDEVNIIGEEGVTVRFNFRDENGEEYPFNSELRDNWLEWCEPENCDVTGMMSWPMMQQMIVRYHKRDGEAFARFIRDRKINRFGFALQLLEPETCDVRLNTPRLSNGNSIIAGVERDGYGKPVAFYFKVTDPFGRSDYSQGGKRYMRFEASEIVWWPDLRRVTQIRGISSFSGISNWLHMHGEMRETVLVNQQLFGNQGWFKGDKDYEQNDGINYEDDDEEEIGAGTGNEHGTGDASEEFTSDMQSETVDRSGTYRAERGVYKWLPQGVEDIVGDNTKVPNDNFADFDQSTLKTIAASRNAQSAALSGEFKGYSWSNMRAEEGICRTVWKRDQSRFISIVAKPVYRGWAWETCFNRVFSREIMPSIIKNPVMRGRRWPYVDPKAESNAHEKKIKNGLDSEIGICEEQGLDAMDILEDRARYLKRKKELEEKHGIKFEEPKKR